jgi:hypothetical protein
MEHNFQEFLNKSQNNEVQVPCLQCTGSTAHEVVVSLDQSGHDSSCDVNWQQSYQIIRCKGCKFISFRDANTNSEDYVQIGHDEWEYAISEILYPSRIEGRRDLGDAVRFLPPDTQRVYRETLKALGNSSPVLAGIGLRALMETVCKERQAAGANLFKQIDDLANQQVLTPAGANILHKIRTLGNAAAHEVKPHTEKQLGLALDILENLLKNVYILPILAAAEFDDDSA